jgi:hypothetical protein
VASVGKLAGRCCGLNRQARAGRHGAAIAVFRRKVPQNVTAGGLEARRLMQRGMRYQKGGITLHRLCPTKEAETALNA